MNRVNLLPGPRRDALHARRILRRWVIICVVWTGLFAGLAACVLAASAGSGGQSSRAEQQVMTEIDELNRAINLLRPQHAALQAQIDRAHIVRDHADWSLLLSIISKQRGDEIIFTRCQVESGKPPAPGPPSKPGGASAVRQISVAREQAGSPTLRLQGLGRSPGAVSQFVLRLEKLALFGHVTLEKSSRETFMGSPVNAFTLTCSFDGSSPVGTPKGGAQ